MATSRLRYHPGFCNEISSEALPHTLPKGQVCSRPTLFTAPPPNRVPTKLVGGILYKAGSDAGILQLTPNSRILPGPTMYDPSSYRSLLCSLSLMIIVMTCPLFRTTHKCVRTAFIVSSYLALPSHVPGAQTGGGKAVWGSVSIICKMCVYV